jgi:hypothetical protein
MMDADKSCSTFDPIREVYGKTKLAVPSNPEDGFYAGFSAER